MEEVLDTEDGMSGFWFCTDCQIKFKPFAYLKDDKTAKKCPQCGKECPRLWVNEFTDTIHVTKIREEG